MRYKVTDVDNERFYMIPKSLFLHGRYKSLSLQAKFIYGVLKDRMLLSRKNGWIDPNGDVYFQYTQKELGDLIGVSASTVCRELKRLHEAGLIDTVRQDMGRPDRIYIHHIPPLGDGEELSDAEERLGEAAEQIEETLAADAAVRENIMENYRKSTNDSEFLAKMEKTLSTCAYGSRPQKMKSTTCTDASTDCNMKSTTCISEMPNCSSEMSNCAPAMPIAPLQPRHCTSANTPIASVQDRIAPVQSSDTDLRETDLLSDTRSSDTDLERLKSETYVDEEDARGRARPLVALHGGIEKSDTKTNKTAEHENGSSTKDGDSADLAVNLYRQNICRNPSPIEIETLHRYANQCPYEWIAEAIRSAVLHNAKNLGYITKILDNWQKYGFKVRLMSQASKSKGHRKDDITEQDLERCDYLKSIYDLSVPIEDTMRKWGS